MDLCEFKASLIYIVRFRTANTTRTYERNCFKQTRQKSRGRVMAWLVKALFMKPHDLSPTLRTYTTEGENQLLEVVDSNKLSLDCSTHVTWTLKKKLRFHLLLESVFWRLEILFSG